MIEECLLIGERLHYNKRRLTVGLEENCFGSMLQAKAPYFYEKKNALKQRSLKKNASGTQILKLPSSTRWHWSCRTDITILLSKNGRSERDLII